MIEPNNKGKEGRDRVCQICYTWLCAYMHSHKRKKNQLHMYNTKNCKKVVRLVTIKFIEKISDVINTVIPIF